MVDTVVTILKEVISLAKKAKNQELLDKLASLQANMIDFADTNYELKKHITKLELEISNLSELTYDVRGYFEFKNRHIGTKFCSICYAKSKIESPILDWERSYRCGVCGFEITKK